MKKEKNDSDRTSTKALWSRRLSSGLGDLDFHSAFWTGRVWRDATGAETSTQRQPFSALLIRQ